MTERLVKCALELLQPDSKPTHIKDVLVQILLRDHPELTAVEMADTYFERVRARLAALYASLQDAETDAAFEFNSSNGDYVQGPLFIEPRDPPAIVVAKQNRLRAQPVRNALKALTFAQFEILATALLSLLGAREFQRTVHSRDQGIDFFGRLSLGDLDSEDFPFFRFQDALQLWLVGQAKHYPDGKVSAPEIRNLVGAVNLARFKEYASTTELLRDLPLRSCDPVFALFLTTGKYTRDAVRLAENSGVVLRDIDDIAKFFCDEDVGRDNNRGCTAESLIQWAEMALADQTRTG